MRVSPLLPRGCRASLQVGADVGHESKRCLTVARIHARSKKLDRGRVYRPALLRSQRRRSPQRAERNAAVAAYIRWRNAGARPKPASPPTRPSAPGPIARPRLRDTTLRGSVSKPTGQQERCRAGSRKPPDHEPDAVALSEVPVRQASIPSVRRQAEVCPGVRHPRHRRALSRYSRISTGRSHRFRLRVSAPSSAVSRFSRIRLLSLRFQDEPHPGVREHDINLAGCAQARGRLNPPAAQQLNDQLVEPLATELRRHAPRPRAWSSSRYYASEEPTTATTGPSRPTHVSHSASYTVPEKSRPVAWEDQRALWGSSGCRARELADAVAVEAQLVPVHDSLKVLAGASPITDHEVVLS
ncbi:hypothetical protein SAMN05216174_113178 [Actinokineospora iranica]|uniref:Uncharacterized protein n=1 Tax=Actinokineospora iranica TaxID=1271860 RepID=A0A1G6W1P9_9PSEU|nr:hypothetical protein SAMN05216174_113178 [Actinokineospora iranica]